MTRLIGKQMGENPQRVKFYFHFYCCDLKKKNTLIESNQQWPYFSSIFQSVTVGKSRWRDSHGIHSQEQGENG